MSLRRQPLPAVPDDTARVARAAFPHGNTYLLLRDELGTLFSDEEFARLYPTRGQPAEAPWRLALVTIFQFLENLSDRRAADAVRGRIDWKYALGLDLTDAGFDSSVLCEFRARLVAGSLEHRLLDALLDRCRHVLARVRALQRLECAGETLRHALNALAVVAPEWLRGSTPAEWAERYGPRCDTYRFPTGADGRRRYADQIGQDGYQEKDEEVSDALDPAAVRPQDVVAAAEKGFRFRRSGPGPVVRTRKTREVVLRLAPDAAGSPVVLGVERVLNLRPGRPSYPLVAGEGSQLAAAADPAGREEIVVTTRSVEQVLHFVGEGVEVPPDHRGAGCAAAGAPGGAADLLRVRVSRCRPPHAAVAVRHRGHWFYIDDTDRESKETFELLLELYNLEIRGGGTANRPRGITPQRGEP